jgi:hypothetical protein
MQKATKWSGTKWIVLCWMMMVIAVLSIGALEPSPLVPEMQRAVEVEEPSFADKEWKYTDYTSAEYKEAVLAVFDGMSDKYGHLNEGQRKKIREMVNANADVFYVDGAEPTTVADYEFDVQLKDNVKPFSAKAPRLSPEQQRKEQHHIKKAMDLGHLVTPNASMLGPWTAPVHVVYKKGDPLGRLIVDFRMLNKSPIEQPISLQNVQDKVRRLAGYRYKAVFDAVHGFNQINASKEAQQKLQIQTSLGIKQYTVLPFGVTNGQGMMWDVFSGRDVGCSTRGGQQPGHSC